MKVGKSFKWLFFAAALANQAQANDRFFTANDGWTPFGNSLGLRRAQARQEITEEREYFYELMLD
jgi:hypothetical protein